MKIAMLISLCLAVFVFANSATLESDNTVYNTQNGSYTIVETFNVGLVGTYGLAIRDDLSNSIWIADFDSLDNIEINMSTGVATGTVWSISSGIDPDDQAFCQYSGMDNQTFFGDYDTSSVAVYDVPAAGTSATFNKNIPGPAHWSEVWGVGAGHDNLYVSNYDDEIGWGAYTGGESSVTWKTIPCADIGGMAVWGDYLFICNDNDDSINLMIMKLNADGSPEPTPVWSCFFKEAMPDGGIDYDGKYLWVYPLEGNLYKLEIDFALALEANTWGTIKTSF